MVAVQGIKYFENREPLHGTVEAVMSEDFLIFNFGLWKMMVILVIKRES